MSILASLQHLIQQVMFSWGVCHQGLPGDDTEQKPNFGVLNCPREVPLSLPSPWRAYRDSPANLAA